MASSIPVVSEEEVNFLRMANLLIKIAPHAVRRLFNREIYPGGLKWVLIQKRHKLDGLKQKGKLSRTQWELLYPTDNSEPSSNNFDITLMVFLLRHLTNIQIQDQTPPITDNSEAAALSRIKIYRNEIAHSFTGCLSKERFDSIWDIVVNAIEKLCPTMKKQCDFLLVAELDHSYREIYLEFMKKEKDLEDIKIQIEHLSTEQNHAENFRQEKKRLWNERLKRFYVTAATKNLTKTVRSNQCVIVTGNSGSGKSVMAFYVACHLEMTQGFLVYPALKPDEIIKVHLPGSNQLFLFDDLFGNIMSEYAISRWEMEAESIKYLLSSNPNVKILITCKSDMYKVEKIRSLGISLIHFDLSSNDQRLTLAERKEIAKLYLSNEMVQQLDDNVIMLYRFFPLLCYMFGKNKLTNTDFFEKPLAVVEQELKILKEKHDDSFIVIGLLVVLNNKIDKELLQTGDKTYVSIIDDLVTFLRFNHKPTIGNLLTSLHGLIPTYIEETECSYTFIHDKVFNVVLYCVGHSLVRCILKHSDASFIGSRLQLENIGERRNDAMLASGEERIYFDKHLQEMKCDSNREILIKTSLIKSCIQPENEGPRTNITIIVSSKDENLYFERLFQEIKCGSNWEVFNNIHTQFTDYRTRFIYYLRQKTGVKFMISPKDGSSALHVSSARGYVEFVEYIIEKDTSQIYSIDNTGKTPLHIASIYGHHDIVRILVCNGSPVDHKDRYNVTSLIFSCFHGQINVVRILLEHEVIVNPVNKDEWIPLHIACEKGHNDIVDLLLKAKAKVNKLNKTGLSPLYIACSNGHTDIAKSLIRHGAGVCRRNTSGTTPLHIACQNGRVAVVKLLLENKASLNISEYDGSTPLNKACRYSQKEVVELLLQVNANVNTELQDGCTPLHTVCDTGNADIAHMLLHFKASVNIEMRDGWTPLHKVSMRGHTDVASALLRYNADINQGNKKKGNITPLHIACGYGNTSFVSFLLEHEPIVNKMDDDGCIPLHVASEHGHQDVVELLLDRGALINLPNKNGSTPLYLSVQNGHTSTTESLIKHEASVNQGNNKGMSPLYVACQKGYSELVNLLLKNNATINKGNVDNKTPMHVICETGRLDLLSMVLNYNDNVELNAPTLLNKLTPMHLACMNGHEALINCLLAHADHKKLDILSITDKNGHTPLYYAYRSNHSTLIQYLLRNGAKMSPTDRNINMSDREVTKERRGKLPSFLSTRF